MARYDVYQNPHAPERRHTPYVIDVQNDHLGPLDTRIVIPLRSKQFLPRPTEALNPVLEVDGKWVVLDTASMAPVPTSMLRRPVMRATPFAGDVADALDTLFGVF